MPFLSFFSRKLYRDVGRNWKGANLAYLFLLLAVCCLPAAISLRNNLLQSLETGQVELINQIPEINIRNGSASVDAAQPHYIHNAEGHLIAILDTTGSMNYIDDKTVQLLLTENKLIVRRGRNLFNTFGFEGIEELHIDKHAINGWAGQLREMVAPLSYGIFLLLSYILAVMVMLLMAVAGLVLSTFMNGRLKFSESLRIATVAATPAIVTLSVSAALGYAASPIPYLAATLLYLVVGLQSCGSVPEADEDNRIDLKARLKEDWETLEEAA